MKLELIEIIIKNKILINKNFSCHFFFLSKRIFKSNYKIL